MWLNDRAAFSKMSLILWEQQARVVTEVGLWSAWEKKQWNQKPAQGWKVSPQWNRSRSLPGELEQHGARICLLLYRYSQQRPEQRKTLIQLNTENKYSHLIVWVRQVVPLFSNTYPTETQQANFTMFSLMYGVTACRELIWSHWRLFWSRILFPWAWDSNLLNAEIDYISDIWRTTTMIKLQREDRFLTRL